MRLQFETEQVEDEILDEFPVTIRHKVARALYRRVVEQCYLFKGCSSEFINQIVSLRNCRGLSVCSGPSCGLVRTGGSWGVGTLSQDRLAPHVSIQACKLEEVQGLAPETWGSPLA